MDLKSPNLRRLYRDWDTWRAGRLFPSRANIDPLSLRYILGNFTVIDVLYNPLRFYYRIHATASAERLSFDLTGKLLDALPDVNLRASIQGTLLAVLKERAPCSVSYDGHVAGIVTGDLEVLVLPFSSDGQTIDTIAYGAHFDLKKNPWSKASVVPANPA